MHLTVVIEPLPGRVGFSARLAAPIELAAEAPTADEAQSRLSAMLDEKLKSGLVLREMPIHFANSPTPGGWLPDDELTREWLQHMRDYRQECESADLERIQSNGDERDLR